MVNTYDLRLEDGKVEKLTFNFNFTVIASRLMEDKKLYPTAMDDSLLEAAKLVSDNMKLAQLNRLMTLMFPFVYASIQATIDKDKSGREIDNAYIKDVMTSIEDVSSLAYVIGYTFESITPKGLPEDKADKKKAPAKKSLSGKK